MKSLISKLSLFIIALLSFTNASAYDFEVDGIYYKLNISSKTATVTYKEFQGDSPYKGNITIPSTVNYLGNNIPVVEIGNYAFFDSKELTSIVLPESIINIGIQSFYNCTALPSIIMPHSLKNIDGDAFGNCISLQSINIPENVTTLGKQAFQNCRSLEVINLPDAITVLPYEIFENCRSLKAIKLPNSLKSIENRAFAWCTSLNNIEFNEVINNIGGSAFSNCTSLISLILPNTITSIGTYAFNNCVNLEDIVLPNNLKCIASETFMGCKKLGFLRIPQNVETIENSAFSGCDNLFELSIPASVKSLGSDAMNGTSFKKLIFEDSPESIAIPNYTWVKSHLVGNSYYTETIYENCKFPSTITEIYVGRNINIYVEPSGKSGNKENDPFYNCTYLKSIDVGCFVSDLKVLSTERYNNLESIKLFCFEPPVIESFTANQYLKVKILVPNEAMEIYQQTDVWKYFWTIDGFDYCSIEEPMTNVIQRSIIGMYDINGRSISDGYHGILIMLYSDGTVKKVIR